MADTKVIVIPDGKICDYIDSKFRNDTPEEYVRQTIEKRLVNEHKYLTSQIKIEYTLQVGSRKPRREMVLGNCNSICPYVRTASGGCGQTAFRNLYFGSTQTNLEISALWITTIFLRRMAIWMK